LNKRKKIFIITITFLMLLGLTTITATNINTNDTTTLKQTQSHQPGITQANTRKYDTINTNETLPIQTDNIQENTEYQETINKKSEEKTQNLKADRTETATTFNNLNDYLTNDAYETVTINISDDIQLAGNITVNNAIKTLTINGNGYTINGNGQYQFLNISHASNSFINNVKIINCTSYIGGAIYSTNSNITIKNTNFLDNNATLEGGAISGYYSNITITQSHLNNNNAKGNNIKTGVGGAISGYFSNITITNTNITNNNATVYGGAIYGNTNSTITITNTNLTNNTANRYSNGYGGAIYGNISSYITIINSTLNNNNARENGGAIYNRGDLFIINTTFNNNTARAGFSIYNNQSNLSIFNTLFNNHNHNYTTILGGSSIIYNYLGNITLSNNIFENNYMATHILDRNGTIKIINSIFNNNHGSVIWMYDSTIDINNCSFTSLNNCTNWYASIISGQGNCELNINNSSFINNTNSYILIQNVKNLSNNIFLNNNGDSILSTSNAVLINNTFMNNIVAGQVLSISGNSSIINCTINNNIKTITNGYAGCALTNRGNLIVQNTTMNNNTGHRGGAINNQGNMTIMNSSLSNNNATYGGSIENRANLVIVNSTLNDNIAQEKCGAINNIVNITIINTTLNNNKAKSGGAICNSFYLTMTNCSLHNNKANNNGGAIENRANLTLINSSLDNNNADYGGAIYGEYNSTMTVTNSTLIYNNANKSGGALYANTSSNITIINSTLNNNIEVAIYNSNGTLNITNTTLNNNTSKFNSGAIYNSFGNITIYNSTLNNNNIEQIGYGGAIANFGNMSITQSTLNNNNAIGISYMGGGAIYNEGNLRIINTTLNNNNEKGDKLFNGGGAIFNVRNLTISDSTLNNNTANRQGGAIWTSGNLTITNTTFNNNNANKGGAIYNCGRNLTIHNSTINNNSAQEGGAIKNEKYEDSYIKDISNIKINKSIFINNIVNNSDGFVIDFKEAHSIVIVDSYFNNNTDNVRDMLFSNAKEDAEVDIHGNSYIDNFLEDTIIEPNVTIVTDNNDKSYVYYVDLNLHEIYNDTVRNGTLNVYVNGALKNSTNVTNGRGKIFIENSDLTKRENNITLEYITLSKHYQNTTTSFIIYKEPSSSVVTVDTVEGLVLDNVTFTARVVDYHGNQVTGGYVQFNVGGKTLKDENAQNIKVLVENGIAQLSYQAESGWIVDTHPNLTVQAVYTGTSIVLANRSNTNKVNIYKRNATVTVSTHDDYVNGTLHIDSVVRDQNGSFINDGVLVFKLNGLSLKDENNKGIIAQVVNGKVHLDVKLPFAYSAKKYNLTAVYSNKIYNKATGTNTTTLKAIPTYVNATVTINNQFSKPVVTGQIYNKFNDAILEGTTIINIKFDGISYAKKVKVNNGTFTETLEGIPIYKPGTHKVEITAGANSHYDAVRQTITTKTTPKYNVTTVFTNITRNKTTTRVQAKILDDKNKNVQKDLKITIKLNGLSFLVNKTVTNGDVDVQFDTTSLKNRNYNLELVSGANTYYNAGNTKTELPKY